MPRENVEIVRRSFEAHDAGGMGWIALTPVVLCAVTAVIALVPCTPQRAKAFRSAWMPAPPPESEPAIVSAVGVRERPAPDAVCSVAYASARIVSAAQAEPSGPVSGARAAGTRLRAEKIE